MFANVDYVLDFTNFSEYDEYVAEEANFADVLKRDVKLKDGTVLKKGTTLNTAQMHKLLESGSVSGKELKNSVNPANGGRSYFEIQRSINAEKKAGRKMAVAQQKELQELRSKTKGLSPNSDEYKALQVQIERKEADIGAFEKEHPGMTGGMKLGFKNQMTKTPASSSKGKSLSKNAKIGIGAGAGAVALTGAGLGIAGARGVGPFATDNAKIARANRLAAKGHLDKANKVLGSVKDKTKLLGAPQAYAASELDY
jgi:hypothetical protein